MAKGTIILRPIMDISVEHALEGDTIFPSAYLYISEEVADDNAAYLETRSLSSTTDESGELNKEHYSKFRLQSRTADKIKITAVNVFSRVKLTYNSNRTQCEFSFGLNIDESVSAQVYNSEQITTGDDTEWQCYKSSLSDLDAMVLSEINDYIKKNNRLPEMILDVYSKAQTIKSGYNYKISAVLISQVYVELDYEEILDIGIHRQVNGAVKAAVAAYKKVGGTWQEIDEAEAKSILKNNTITQGGS